MRQLTAAAAIAAIGMLVAACGGNNQSSPSSSTTTTTTTTTTRPPVAQAALANLLLSMAEIDTALGLTGTASKEKIDKLEDDNVKQKWPAGWQFPAECLDTLNAGEAPVYASSGYTAVSGDDDSVALPAGSNDPDPEVTQVVVLFPSAKEANAFFTASSQRWPACANREFTSPGDPTMDNVAIDFKVGAVSNANGILIATINGSMVKPGTPSLDMGTCQRALTVRNNVAIDVSGCRKDPGDLGVNVLNQIAGKVDKQ